MFSPDEWQAYTAEVVEIRKMTFSYRRTMLANDKKAIENKPNDKKAGGKNPRRRRKEADASHRRRSHACRLDPDTSHLDWSSDVATLH